MSTSRSIQATLYLMIASMAVTAVCGVMLAFQIRDARDLVEIRNSMLVEQGGFAAFDWKPDRIPDSYLREQRRPPDEFTSVVREIIQREAPATDFALATALARHLIEHRRKPGIPIQSDTLTAYRKIVNYGRGYCADYTQVFSGLTQAAGLPSREWGMSFKGYSGDGHAFSEIYDRDSARWIFLDVFNSFYVTDGLGRPLSVAEFRAAIESGDSNIAVVPLVPSQFNFRNASAAVEYYRRGSASFFMVWGNNVFSYDGNPIVSALDSWSRSAGQLAAIALDLEPALMIQRGWENPSGLARLRMLRSVLLTTTVSAIVLCVSMVIFVILRRSSRR